MGPCYYISTRLAGFSLQGDKSNLVPQPQIYRSYDVSINMVPCFAERWSCLASARKRDIEDNLVKFIGDPGEMGK
jgi:hypothetical protein